MSYLYSIEQPNRDFGSIDVIKFPAYKYISRYFLNSQARLLNPDNNLNLPRKIILNSGSLIREHFLLLGFAISQSTI